MKPNTAFVGDVHGNVRALRSLLAALATTSVSRVVFLGDYINKGAESREVMNELVNAAKLRNATLLRGNHEATLLDALDTNDLTRFLKIGGAMTIRSYVGRSVHSDVLLDFRNNLPAEHIETIRLMPEKYETEELIAQHYPPPRSLRKFRISAHLPVGNFPVVRNQSAQIDTGCGDGTGRLTAFLWPTRSYVQVDTNGYVVKS